MGAQLCRRFFVSFLAGAGVARLGSLRLSAAAGPLGDIALGLVLTVATAFALAWPILVLAALVILAFPAAIAGHPILWSAGAAALAVGASIGFLGTGTKGLFASAIATVAGLAFAAWNLARPAAT